MQIPIKILIVSILSFITCYKVSLLRIPPRFLRVDHNCYLDLLSADSPFLLEFQLHVLKHDSKNECLVSVSGSTVSRRCTHLFLPLDLAARVVLAWHGIPAPLMYARHYVAYQEEGRKDILRVKELAQLFQ